MKYVAVEGMTVTYGENSVASSTLGPASSVTKVDGNGVYAGMLSISVSGADNGVNTGGSGSGFFIPGSSYCTVDHQKVLIEGDEATIVVEGTIKESGLPASWNVTAKIQSAGQTHVKAE